MFSFSVIAYNMKELISIKCVRSQIQSILDSENGPSPNPYLNQNVAILRIPPDLHHHRTGTP